MGGSPRTCDLHCSAKMLKPDGYDKFQDIYLCVADGAEERKETIIDP